MIINFYNIEDLLFINKVDSIHQKYSYIFDEWAYSKATGNINNINSLKIKLLNLIDKDDIEKIESYYKDVVILKKIENNIVKNFDSFDNVDMSLYSDFCLFKNKYNTFLTCWR
jgi:hypothetical protein